MSGEISRSYDGPDDRDMKPDDVLLVDIDCATLPLVQLLAYLSITTAARDKLSARANFAARARTRVERDDPERAEALLAGLA